MPRFAEAKVSPIFPTLVWSHLLVPEDRDRINGAFRRKVAELLPPGETERATKTWQTDQKLHTLPELQEFNEMVLEAAQAAMNFLEVEDYAFEITGCWANVSPPGNAHRLHQHPNNYLGGVYYVDLPGASNTITFYDPRPQAHVVAPKTRKDNHYNSGVVTFQVQEGLLIIFPAWLVHSVNANPANRNRISVSFNIMYSDFAQEVAPAKWQGNVSLY